MYPSGAGNLSRSIPPAMPARTSPRKKSPQTQTLIRDATLVLFGGKSGFKEFQRIESGNNVKSQKPLTFRNVALNNAKSRSADNIRKSNSIETGLERMPDYTETEETIRLSRFIAAEVSPMTSRRFYSNVLPALPRILQLKNNERRRSRSVHEFNTQQRAALEKDFTKTLSFTTENKYWSHHWQIARQGIVRRREGLPSIDHTDEIGQELEEDDVGIEEEGNKSKKEVLTEPSLEERLALIERKQGIIH